jgi:hypothetical protein
VLYTAVIVTLPEASPVANPAELMLTTFESEELHWDELVTFFVVPSESFAVPVNCCVPPVAMDIEPGVT